jgi:hypothetical protein
MRDVERLPLLARGDGQQQEGGPEEGQVEQHLAPGSEQAGAQVRVSVAPDEQHLEEQHARRPHRRAAAEPGQDEAGDERLHQEEEECAGGGGEREGEPGHERRGP